MEELLRRKIDAFLLDWKDRKDKKPLIVKGARQVGKTRSIEWFAYNNYKSVVQINQGGKAGRQDTLYRMVRLQQLQKRGADKFCRTA